MNVTKKVRDGLRLRLDKFRIIPKNKSECYGWNGAIDTRGFGRISLKGKIMGAHRAAWMERYGKIPEFKFVRHSCENKSCTNPNHLVTSINRTKKLKHEERKSGRLQRERLSVDLPTRYVWGVKRNSRKRNMTITRYMCILISKALEKEKYFEVQDDDD